MLEIDETQRASKHSRWAVLQNKLILHSQGLVIKMIKRRAAYISLCQGNSEFDCRMEKATPSL